MILIADSGGTKTDWLLIHSSGLRKGEVIATFHTQGITPIHQTPDVIRHILGQELMSQLSTFPRAQLMVFFPFRIITQCFTVVLLFEQ